MDRITRSTWQQIFRDLPLLAQEQGMAGTSWSDVVLADYLRRRYPHFEDRFRSRRWQDIRAHCQGDAQGPLPGRTLARLGAHLLASACCRRDRHAGLAALLLTLPAADPEACLLLGDHVPLYRRRFPRPEDADHVALLCYQRGAGQIDAGQDSFRQRAAILCGLHLARMMAAGQTRQLSYQEDLALVRLALESRRAPTYASIANSDLALSAGTFWRCQVQHELPSHRQTLTQMVDGGTDPDLAMATSAPFMTTPEKGHLLEALAQERDALGAQLVQRERIRVLTERPALSGPERMQLLLALPQTGLSRQLRHAVKCEPGDLVSLYARAVDCGLGQQSQWREQAVAQCRLGCMYLEGVLGTPAEAALIGWGWLRLAAENGHPGACYRRAQMLSRRAADEALIWLERALGGRDYALIDDEAEQDAALALLMLHERSPDRVPPKFQVAWLTLGLESLRRQAYHEKRIMALEKSWAAAKLKPVVKAAPIPEPAAGVPAVDPAGRVVFAGPMPVPTDRELRDALKPYESLLDVPLPCIPAPDYEALARRLTDLFPWMRSAIDNVRQQTMLAYIHGQPFGLRPLLLVGPPGIGKTEFVRELARQADLPMAIIQIGGMSDSMDLRGSARGWGNTQPGRIVQTIAHYIKANPLILLDEIDKEAESRRNGRSTETLLGLLEPASAAHWRDDCLQVSCDLSGVSYIATANSIAHLDSALLSRFQIIEVSPPKRNEREVLLDNIIRRQAARYGIDPQHLPDFPDEIRDRLLREFRDARHMSRAVTILFGNLIDPRYQTHH